MPSAAAAAGFWAEGAPQIGARGNQMAKVLQVPEGRVCLGEARSVTESSSSSLEI